MTDLKESKTVSISFAILDDLQEMHRLDKKIVKTPENIRSFLDDIMKYFNEREYSDVFNKTIYTNSDPTLYFIDQFNKETLYDSPNFIDNIVSTLMEDEYFVRNRVEKYYVVAFAINYTKFEVYSKDCDAQLIDWGHDGSGKGLIKDPDYNENPVVKLIKQIND